MALIQHQNYSKLPALNSNANIIKHKARWPILNPLNSAGREGGRTGANREKLKKGHSYVLFLNPQTHGNINFIIYVLVLTCLLKVLCKANSRKKLNYLRIDHIYVYDWQMVSTWIYKEILQINKKITNRKMYKGHEQTIHGRETWMVNKLRIYSINHTNN